VTASSVPQTAFLYARVSTEEQTRGFSLQTQLEAMRRYCAERNYVVIGEFTDAHSGTELDRPGINELLERLPLDKPDVVVIYDVDRLGRELVVQALLERDLTRYGARIEYVLGGGSATPEAELLRLVKGAIAVYENRQRVERSRRGKRGRVAAGFPIPTGARAPFGYRYVKQGPKRGTLEIVEHEAEIVRKVFHWLVYEGCTTYEIAKRLTEMQVPSGTSELPIYRAIRKREPNAWPPQTVARMVKNPVYKGEFAWGKRRVTKVDGKLRVVPLPPEEWVVAQVPAIVSPELWEAAQQRLQENRERARRNTKHEYLLRSILVCVCGRRMVGRYKTNAGIRYYRCSTTEAEPWRPACPARWSYRADELEDLVWRTVIDHLSQPELLRVAIEERQRQEREGRAALEARLQSCAREIEAVESKLAQLLRAELDGYPKSVIEGERKRLLELREGLLRQQEALRAELAADYLEWPDIETAMAALREIVQLAAEAATFEEKRRVLELLRVRVEAIDRHTVRVSGIIPVSIVTLSSAKS